MLSTAISGELPRKLTEAWPTPPWEKLAEARAGNAGNLEELSFLRAVRDHLRIRHVWTNEHWLCRPGQEGGGLLRIALDVMDGKATVRQAEARIEALKSEWTTTTIRNATTLYRHAGHTRDLGALRCFKEKNEEQWEICKPVKGRSGLYRSLAAADTLAEAAGKLPEALDRLEKRTAARKKDGPGRYPYEIRWEIRPGETKKRYGVFRKHAGRRILVHQCAGNEEAALAEARDRIRNHRNELDAWFERWRTLPEARNRSNERRTPAADAGTDDPEEFTRRFAFRGVQFGNWVSAARRRDDLTDASQGLEDLAEVLGWPARALSLGGALGLAFGARGHGGPQRTKAHYEPAQRVIAISKPAGPGSLAHEWFHALDHEASRLAGDGHGFATEILHYVKDHNSPADRLARAMYAYGCLLNTLGMVKRSRKLDERRPRSEPYWSTTRELAARAFEAWIRWRLAQRGIRNDYLVNIAPASRWNAPDELGIGYPYPTLDELREIDDKLSAIADAGRQLVPQWADTQHDERQDGPPAGRTASRYPLAAAHRC